MKKYLLILTALVGGMVATKGYSQEFTYGPTPTYSANPSYVVANPNYAPNPNYSSNQYDSSDEGFYVGAFGGANWLNSHHHLDAKHKTGFTAGGSLGYKFNNGLRTEAEIGYRHNQLKSIGGYGHDDGFKGHIKTWSYMGNVLYDFENETPITPYIGAGIGYAKNHASGSARGDSEKFSTGGIAYQGIVGASYEICDKTQLGLEYRYFRSKNLVTDHSVNLAIRRSF